MSCLFPMESGQQLPLFNGVVCVFAAHTTKLPVFRLLCNWRIFGIWVCYSNGMVSLISRRSCTPSALARSAFKLNLFYYFILKWHCPSHSLCPLAAPTSIYHHLRLCFQRTWTVFKPPLATTLQIWNSATTSLLYSFIKPTDVALCFLPPAPLSG